MPEIGPPYYEVLKEAARCGKPVVYEVDDLLWALPADHPDQRTYFYTDSLLPGLIALSEADAVIVATEALKDTLSPFNSNIFVLHNYLNDDLWQLRPPVLTEPEVVTIGYVGGGSHLPDLQLVTAALQALLEQHGQKIELVFWGGEPPQELLAHPNVHWQPLNTENYAMFVEYMSEQSMDIFIAPLSDNLFNACKSAIKYLESSTLGIPGVCSAVGPYKRIVRHQETGYLAANHDEWVAALNILIQNPEKRYQIACAAQEEIRTNWCLSSQKEQFPQAYNQIVSQILPRAGRLERSDLLHDAAVQLRGKNSALQQKLFTLHNQAEKAEQARIELEQIKNRRSWQLLQWLTKTLLHPKRQTDG